ncbi:MAG: adenylosuccinate lyase, partial [Pseudomonadales bacterium]
MAKEKLTAISPLDGRYADKTKELSGIFSEYGLIKYRVEIEIRWLQMLANNPEIIDLDKFDTNTNNQLNQIIDNFDVSDA